MATNITPFFFESAPVRTAEIDGAPWFVAADVCSALGFGNARQAVATHVDSDDVQQMDTIDSMGRTQSINVVNESGMYALTFGSKLESAKRFKKWVTSEVLPAIRKTGSYTAPGAAPSTPATERATIAMMVAESAARILRIEGVPLLGYITDVAEQFSPEAARALPSYGANRPAGSAVSANSELTRSLTDLLKIHGIDSIARKINPLLIAAGILEKKTRPSSKGGIKEFLSVTARGLQYGINQTAKQNQLETSPRFFESRFPAMMAESGRVA